MSTTENLISRPDPKDLLEPTDSLPVAASPEAKAEVAEDVEPSSGPLPFEYGCLVASLLPLLLLLAKLLPVAQVDWFVPKAEPSKHSS